MNSTTHYQQEKLPYHPERKSTKNRGTMQSRQHLQCHHTTRERYRRVKRASTESML
ncbi:hypothetical protein PI124_g5288 [Phytophthora idaei]|nr:hypothetical protein PI126_g4916 [Phytophthora idaei]KAG3250076.1 hypothetical protein PI124_g5288 [Phytophthora idaei]